MTAQGKTTTARIVADMVLMTADRPDGLVQPAARKTDAVTRTVASTERRHPGQYERRIRTVVHFTDGTRSVSCSASQTWTLAPAVEEAPVEEPAPAPAPAAAKPAGTCACCGGTTKGGHYLPGHDARHASRLVKEILEGRDVQDALAEIPAKHQPLVAKVTVRLGR